jgi:hypothetical protein
MPESSESPATGKHRFTTGLAGEFQEISEDCHAVPCYHASAGKKQTTINNSPVEQSQK